MIVLALGQKGSGKSRLLRMLAAARLQRWQTSSVLVHDAQAQYEGGKAFERADDVRRYIQANGSRPRLMLVRQDDAANVCQLAWELGQVTCVIDELDLVCKAKVWESDAARSIAHYGRHRQVDLFGSFRFTRNINEDLPALADFIFLMRHSGAALYDLRTIRQRFGDAYAREVVNLQNHEAIVWHDAVSV